MHMEDFREEIRDALGHCDEAYLEMYLEALI